jgi:hypothetical protein
MTVSERTGVIREVAELVQTLQQQQDTDADTVLAELTQSSASAMPGSTPVSPLPPVAASCERHRPPVLNRCCSTKSSNDTTRGPCLSAAWENHVIGINDMTLELGLIFATHTA